MATQALPPMPDSAAAPEWSIGPVINGRNYSQGMPPNARRGENGEVWFDFPFPTAREGHVHYVTLDPENLTGPIAGARALRLVVRIEAAEGVRFVPQEAADRTALLSLYIQRRGDDWRSRNGSEWFRWYAPWQQRLVLTPGTHEVLIPLEAEWQSVNGRQRSDAPRAFTAALEEAGQVGFTLGSDRGLGHGVYATGPARLTVVSFELVR